MFQALESAEDQAYQTRKGQRIIDIYRNISQLLRNQCTRLPDDWEAKVGTVDSFIDFSRSMSVCAS